MARRPVRVVDVALPTPRATRIVVRGELADWPEPGPAAHLTLFLPDTPSGPVMRTYTVRDWDREQGELTIDMSINDGSGPATQWASRVVPGMWLEISGRSQSEFAAAPDGGRYLFGGDETAVPAVVTCLASLPPTATATAILAVADEHERQPFETLAQADVRWLYRDDDGPGFVEAVIAAVADTQPERVWVACEDGAMRAIRLALLDAGFPPGGLNAQAYWKRGEPSRPSGLQPRPGRTQ